MRMKRTCSWALIAFATMAWPTMASALPNENGEYAKLGVGNLECDVWTQARQIGDVNAVWWKTLILGWVQGFLTAYNSYGPVTSDVSEDTDAEGITRWVDDFCLQHPSNNISGAAEALVAELLKPHRSQLRGSSNRPQ
jgi:hypothetical protein